MEPEQGGSSENCATAAGATTLERDCRSKTCSLRENNTRCQVLHTPKPPPPPPHLPRLTGTLKNARLPDNYRHQFKYRFIQCQELPKQYGDKDVFMDWRANPDLMSYPGGTRVSFLLREGYNSQPQALRVQLVREKETLNNQNKLSNSSNIIKSISALPHIVPTPPPAPSRFTPSDRGAAEVPRPPSPPRRRSRSRSGYSERARRSRSDSSEETSRTLNEPASLDHFGASCDRRRSRSSSAALSARRSRSRSHRRSSSRDISDAKTNLTKSAGSADEASEAAEMSNATEALTKSAGSDNERSRSCRRSSSRDASEARTNFCLLYTSPSPRDS